MEAAAHISAKSHGVRQNGQQCFDWQLWPCVALWQLPYYRQNARNQLLQPSIGMFCPSCSSVAKVATGRGK
jgi:hypothetical protein